MDETAFAITRFATELKRLHVAAGAPRYQTLIDQARDQPTPITLTSTTLSDWFSGKSVPRTPGPVKFLVAYLQPIAQRRVQRPLASWPSWKRLLEAAQDANRTGSAGSKPWPRVGERSAVEMGVHPAAFLPPSTSPLRLWRGGPAQGDATPAYVARAHDEELRSALGEAVERGTGVVLVVGRSCTGKSRSAWRAVSEGFGDWFLADLRRPEDRRRLHEGDRPPGDYVLWLDNLHLAEDVPHLVETARAALADPDPPGRCVVVATMWRQPEIDRESSTSARALRDLAKIAGVPVTVQEDWTPTELADAHRLASADRLLAAALAQTDVSPTQVLAGAKWVLGLWRGPHLRETTAVLDAAIDLGRLGIGIADGAVLSRELLERCAPFYLDRPPATADWFERALGEATTPLEDAVWALIPPRPGLDGYRLFDPLLDYARFDRHFEVIPAGVWDALAAADLSREDFTRLAAAAGHRLLLRYEAIFEERATKAESRPVPAPKPAKRLARTPAEAPETPAAPPIRRDKPLRISLESPDRDRADVLLAADDLDGLLELAIDHNDTFVRRRLAMLYERRGDRRNLRELATFSRRGARHWAQMLAGDGDPGELLRAVVCGDGFAKRALRDWDVAGLSNAERERILRVGLTPDGEPDEG